MKNIPYCPIILILLWNASCGGPPADEFPTEGAPPAPAVTERSMQTTPTLAPAFSPQPVQSPAVVQTDTAEPLLPSFTEAPTPFESPYTAEMISPIYYGVFHNFILLGAYSSGQWLQPEEVYGLLYEDAAYDFYFDRQYIGVGTANVRQPVYFGPPGYCNFISAHQSIMGGEPPSFALPQGQPAALRPVEEISVDTPLYLDAVAEWLSLQEIPAPTVKITRIVRVDLEGDGTDEVLISASYFLEETGHMVVAGDYSLVLMRKVVGGQVYTVPLAQEVYYGNTPILRFPSTYYLDNVFDLNGDGRYEVIVAETWWEGSGYIVHEMHVLNAVEVLRLTCGL